MTDTSTSNHASSADLPRAEVASAGGLSAIWLIPLVAALVGAWLVYQTMSERGPEITIAFERGDDIEAGKTTIRYKAVEIGQITAVQIADDLGSIVATARIEKHFASKLNSNTRFWVVRPRIGASGISGLGTLVSGAYIEIDPGDGARETHFVGLETPPIVTADAPGKRYLLETDELGPIQAGSPIYFRDIQVGEALGYELAADGSKVKVPVFVRDPYTKLVRESTKFWQASGISVSLSADGVDVNTGSLQSLLVGGITFDYPLDNTEPPAAEDSHFWLYDSIESVGETIYTEKVPYVLYFDDSVRGLGVGAPVEFRGIKLGTVADIGLELDESNLEIRIPVTVILQPQRLSLYGTGLDSVPQKIIESLVDRGLRARLQTGNLLTGQLFVELGLYPDSEARTITGRLPHAQIPTLPSEFAEIKHSVTELLDKLHKLPFQEIGRSTAAATASLERLLTGPEIRETLAAAHSSFDSLKDFSDRLEADLVPLTKQLRTTLADLDRKSPIYLQVTTTLEQMESAARALRNLTEAIERRPDVLIWGRKPEDPAEPETR